LRRRLACGDGPLYLSVGGVEARKNTVAILQAFLQVRRDSPGARLVVAGGASLLDHSAYANRFLALAQEAGLAPGPGSPVTLLGRVADEDMPRLYRCADALVFPSLREGFGLAVLEAMACGTPAVVSRIPPFTEYLPEDACAWADPGEPASIATAMTYACQPEAASKLRAAGHALAADYTWSRTARQHLDIYHSIHSSTGTHHA
jgi:glycosyltransferase involved in cell wall biosynthesis